MDVCYINSVKIILECLDMGSSSISTLLFEVCFGMVIPLFMMFSVGLFIRDGLNAKEEGRKREKKYTVCFIIAMILLAIYLGIFALFCYIFQNS